MEGYFTTSSASWSTICVRCKRQISNEEAVLVQVPCAARVVGFMQEFRCRPCAGERTEGEP